MKPLEIILTAISPFASMGVVFFIAQPIIMAMLLKVCIGGEYFWNGIVPIVAVGLVVAMLCILFFTKRKQKKSR